jgi:hypothetical protein
MMKKVEEMMTTDYTVFQQDQTKAMESYMSGRAELGSGKAYYWLGEIYFRRRPRSTSRPRSYGRTHELARMKSWMCIEHESGKYGTSRVKTVDHLRRMQLGVKSCAMHTSRILLLDQEALFVENINRLNFFE